MSIQMIVTAGFGNGTISGSVADVVLRGYSSGAAAAWYPYWAPRSVKTIGAFIMYPRNAASPERISVGPVVQISDGAVQSSGVSIAVVPQGGASGAGGGTTAYDNGTVLYTPTQAETNYASFVVTAYKTGCIPASVTVVTTSSATTGYAGVDWSKITSPTTTVNLSGTTIKTATDVETDTADIQTRLPAALVSGRMDASLGAAASDVITAAALAADAVTEIQSGLATASAVSTLQTSVDDLPTSAELATALGTADDAVLAALTSLNTRVDSLGIKKNTAFSNFEFVMVLASDHATPATGLTVTGQRSIDGGAFASVTGTIAEVSNGVYQFDAATNDTNGDVITWRFSSATAEDLFVTFRTVTA